MKRTLCGALLIVLAAGCGTALAPEERLAGYWVIMEPEETIVFREDGTWVLPEEGESGRWTLAGEDELILTVFDSEGNEEGVTELVFQGEDAFTLTMQGETLVFHRVEE